MYERLILRYSGKDTIQEHIDVLSGVGAGGSPYTWWGWWAKEDQEPIPFDWLEWASGLARSGNGLRVGLVDRKLGRYAVAHCTEVAYGQQGNQLSAPDGGTRTPEYYRSASLPAWFRMDRIEILSLTDFEREFVEIPVGDATMYVVDMGEDERREILPKPNWDFALREVSGHAILQISDLHFGSFHGYVTERSVPGTSVGGVTLCDRLSQIIEGSGLEVGVVFVTGDLASRGVDIRRTLEQFEAMASRLRTRFGLLPTQYVIVPGNHDFLTVTDYVTMKLDYKHELEFKQFIKDFYGRETITDLEQPFRFLLSNGVQVAGLALNSARLRDEQSRDYGFVARHRYERLLKMTRNTLDPLGKGPERSTVFTTLLHHHLVPVNPIDSPAEGRHVSVTVDAGDVVDDLVRAGVQVAFHGHQHLPFFGSVRASRPKNASWNTDLFERELMIVGAGSAGVTRASLPDVFPFNTVALFDVHDDGSAFDTQTWRYLPGMDPGIATRCTLPISDWLPLPV